jgi:proteic killer suppression protein
MIDTTSIRHRGLREFATKGRSRQIPQTLVKRVAHRLTILDQISSIAELPSTYYAHELARKRRGVWSIRVSGAWRMTFRFRDETVLDLDLEQYH